jgi:K+-transporting ATPase ATPase C chain
MKETLLVSLRATLVTIVLTALLYPLVVTGIAQTLFPTQANGSIVRGDDGTVIGSELFAQGFANPAYVWPRPSAGGYCVRPDSGEACSAGSNLGPTSKKLRDGAEAAAKSVRDANPDAKGEVPAELVTASGSGLDPHLSPASAGWQVPRIAKARGVSEERVQAVVSEYVEGRDLGFLGEPRVNVLRLNLALDRRFGKARAANIPPK